MYSLIPPTLFHSTKHPDRSVRYVVLNQSAEKTVLYSYGAGGSSIAINDYQAFLTHHASLCILCVDRFVQGKSCARDHRMYDEWAELTLELLMHLSIPALSIVCHSAGIYAALSLAALTPARIDQLFLLCTHIPVSATDSQVMKLLPKLPNWLLGGIIKTDSMAGTWIRRFGSVDKVDTKHVPTPELRSLVLRYQAPPDEQAAVNETEMIDMQACYEKVPGIDGKELKRLYTDCTANVVWFTSTKDVFFGPRVVRPFAEQMRSAKVEVVEYNDATHANIFLRTDVWEEIVLRAKNFKESDCSASNR